MPTSVDSFLAHYGVKGMKWGVTRDNPEGVTPTRKMVRQVTKETRREQTLANRAEWATKSGKEKTKILALDLATAGGYTASQLAKTEGYSRGKRAAYTLMGGQGAVLIRDAQVRNEVRRKLGG